MRTVLCVLALFMLGNQISHPSSIRSKNVRIMLRHVNANLLFTKSNLPNQS